MANKNRKKLFTALFCDLAAGAAIGAGVVAYFYPGMLGENQSIPTSTWQFVGALAGGSATVVVLALRRP